MRGISPSSRRSWRSRRVRLRTHTRRQRVRAGRRPSTSGLPTRPAAFSPRRAPGQRLGSRRGTSSSTSASSPPSKLGARFPAPRRRKEPTITSEGVTSGCVDVPVRTVLARTGRRARGRAANRPAPRVARVPRAGRGSRRIRPRVPRSRCTFRTPRWLKPKAVRSDADRVDQHASRRSATEKLGEGWPRSSTQCSLTPRTVPSRWRRTAMGPRVFLPGWCAQNASARVRARVCGRGRRCERLRGFASGPAVDGHGRVVDVAGRTSGRARACLDMCAGRLGGTAGCPTGGRARRGGVRRHRRLREVDSDAAMVFTCGGQVASTGAVGIAPGVLRLCSRRRSSGTPWRGRCSGCTTPPRAR